MTFEEVQDKARKVRALYAELEKKSMDARGRPKSKCSVL